MLLRYMQISDIRLVAVKSQNSIKACCDWRSATYPTERVFVRRSSLLVLAQVNGVWWVGGLGGCKKGEVETETVYLHTIVYTPQVKICF